MRAACRLLRSPILLGTLIGAVVAVIVARDKDADPGARAEYLTGAMFVFVPTGAFLGLLVRLGRRYRIVRRT